ncbi:MAG: hypothetical protein JXA89_12830 [Anaerolineae bacterium]|nr:hypothetical protein [Anaerolineae bacterium]
MRVTFRVLKFVIAIGLLPLLLGFIIEATNVLVESTLVASSQWFFGGLLAYAFLHLLGLRHYTTFVAHYVHESAHVFAAFLTFHPVRKMIVNPYPGPGEEPSHIQIPSGFLDEACYLAPYCLPLLALPFLIGVLLIPIRFVWIANLLIGVTMGFFYMNLLHEFGGSPTDFPGAGGFIFSAVIVALMNAILLVVVLSVVTANYAGIVSYFQLAWIRSLANYQAVIQMWNTARALI